MWKTIAETIPDTLSLGKETRMLIQLSFFHFPGAVRQNKRRQRWITACHRRDSFVCTKDIPVVTFAVYSLCVEMVQQTVASKEKVSLSVFRL